MSLQLRYQSSPVIHAYSRALLINPVEVIRQNSLLDTHITRIKTVTEFNSFIAQHTPINPLCALLECIGPRCPLNRINHPHIREQFEDTVVRHTGSQDPLSYVSLGAGALLQDVFLLNKIMRTGCTQVTIHLIDPLYANYITMIRDMVHDETNSTMISQPVTLPPTVSADEALYFIHMHTQFQQFLAAVHQPSITIDCFIYAHLHEYVLHCAHNHAMRAHLGTLVDADCKALLTDMKELITHGMHRTGVFLYLDDTGIPHTYSCTATSST